MGSVSRGMSALKNLNRGMKLNEGNNDRPVEPESCCSAFCTFDERKHIFKVPSTSRGFEFSTENMIGIMLIKRPTLMIKPSIFFKNYQT